jgi:hypothetical protein
VFFQQDYIFERLTIPKKSGFWVALHLVVAAVHLEYDSLLEPWGPKIGAFCEAVWILTFTG